MSTLWTFALGGLGTGAAIAALAVGVVLTHRASGVVNLAHAATGLYLAAVYFEFRTSGDLILPVLGITSRVHLLDAPTQATGLVVVALWSCLIGAALYWLVFRPLRSAPPLGRLVASLGLLVYFSELVRLRYRTAGATVAPRGPVLDETPLRIGGAAVAANRLWFAALVVVVAAVLSAMLRWSRFGLVVRAAADNDKGALLMGWRPDRVGVVSAALATVLGGFAVILVEPIAGLDPIATSLLIVPALGAALVGRLVSVWAATLAGIGIGMAQSVVLGYAVRPSATWIPDWLTPVGLQQLVPVAVIAAGLAWRGDVVEGRVAMSDRRLAAVPAPQRLVLAPGLVVTGGVVLALGLDAAGRRGLVVSMIAAILSLSVVVLCGYVGRISLAQLTIAGVAGFSVVRLGDGGVGFPLDLLGGVLAATACGLVLGAVTSRLAGVTFAVATLAAAVAIEQVVLASPSVSGGVAGRAAVRPSLWGVDLGAAALGADDMRPAFVVLVAVLLAVSVTVVLAVRRSAVGARWLAVRDHPRVAQSVGVDVGRARLSAFAVSAALAGLSGGLTAYSTTTLSPASFMVIGSLVVVALTYVAGVTTVGGALLAGAFVPSGLVTAISGSNQTAQSPNLAISGAVLVVAAVLLPDGIVGALCRTLAVPNRVAPNRTKPPSLPPDQVQLRESTQSTTQQSATQQSATQQSTEPSAAPVPALEVRDVVVRFGGVRAVDHANLVVGSGEIHGLIGPNGAGKSSLLDAISGFTPIASGAVVVGGESVSGLAPHQLTRRGLARTFQRVEVFEDLTVAEQLVVAADAHRHRPVDLTRLADWCGLDEILGRRGSDLDHDQRQRVSLARVLATAPSVVLLDEPAAGLDAAEVGRLVDTVRRIAAEGIGVLLVEHDMHLIFGLCATVSVLDRGQMIASGPAEQVASHPRVVDAYLGSRWVGEGRLS